MEDGAFSLGGKVDTSNLRLFSQLLVVSLRYVILQLLLELGTVSQSNFQGHDSIS